MKSSRQMDRSIVIRHIGRVADTEVLLNIIKLYIEAGDFYRNGECKRRPELQGRDLCQRKP